MTISVEFGDRKGGRLEGVQVATNRGWVEFGQFVDKLPLKNYLSLVELWEHGHTYQVKRLEKELERLLAKRQPEGGVKSVGENLLALVRQNIDSDVLCVADDS